MIAIKSIKVEQAEGDPDKFVKGTVARVPDANSLLRDIAWDGPDMGYYKTDVWVTWSDDVEVKLRHDVMRHGEESNDTDVTRHLQGWARFIKKTAKSWGQPEEAIKLADEILEGKRAVL
jgi:hypothetical protein